MTPSVEAAPARLSGRRRFAAVRAHRVRVSVGSLQLAGMPNGLAYSRVGFAIVDVRGAVVRNRIRRRLREASRLPLQANPGIDVVLRAGVDVASRPFAALAADLSGAFDELGRRIAARVREAYNG